MNQKKPFDRAQGFRSLIEIRRDYVWDNYNRTWAEKVNKATNDNFYKDSVLVIAYPALSSLDDRKAILSKEVSLEFKNDNIDVILGS